MRCARDQANACISSEAGAPLSQSSSLYRFCPPVGFNRLLPKGEKTGQRFLSGTMAANILKKSFWQGLGYLLPIAIPMERAAEV